MYFHQADFAFAIPIYTISTVMETQIARLFWVGFFNLLNNLIISWLKRKLTILQHLLCQCQHTFWLTAFSVTMGPFQNFRFEAHLNSCTMLLHLTGKNKPESLKVDSMRVVSVCKNVEWIYESKWFSFGEQQMSPTSLYVLSVCTIKVSCFHTGFWVYKGCKTHVRSFWTLKPFQSAALYDDMSALLSAFFHYNSQ